MKRPDLIRHWRELEPQVTSSEGDGGESFTIRASLSRAAGLNRLNIAHERLLPGRRCDFPHADSHDETFIYVIEGYPQAWINGYVYGLEPGDSLALTPGTGICYTLLNNSDSEVQLLVVREACRSGNNRVYYPLDHVPGAAARWIDHPPQFFGPHSGKPDRRYDK